MNHISSFGPEEKSKKRKTFSRNFQVWHAGRRAFTPNCCRISRLYSHRLSFLSTICLFPAFLQSYISASPFPSPSFPCSVLPRCCCCCFARSFLPFQTQTKLIVKQWPTLKWRAADTRTKNSRKNRRQMPEKIRQMKSNGKEIVKFVGNEKMGEIEVN